MIPKITKEDYEDMKRFVLNHSNIEEKFIDDFFSIQQDDKYKDYNPFLIDLDVFAVWINVRKSDLKFTLVSNYKKNIDYKIIGKEKTLKRYREVILLTVSCFKKIAIRSNSKKGNIVVDYYLLIEELMIQYNRVITHNLKVPTFFKSIIWI